jgi:hypothetical protein
LRRVCAEQGEREKGRQGEKDVEKKRKENHSSMGSWGRGICVPVSDGGVRWGEDGETVAVKQEMEAGKEQSITIAIAKNREERS